MAGKWCAKSLWKRRVTRNERGEEEKYQAEDEWKCWHWEWEYQPRKPSKWDIRLVLAFSRKYLISEKRGRYWLKIGLFWMFSMARQNEWTSISHTSWKREISWCWWRMNSGKSNKNCCLDIIMGMPLLENNYKNGKWRKIASSRGSNDYAEAKSQMLDFFSILLMGTFWQSGNVAYSFYQHIACLDVIVVVKRTDLIAVLSGQKTKLNWSETSV